MSPFVCTQMIRNNIYKYINIIIDKLYIQYIFYYSSVSIFTKILLETDLISLYRGLTVFSMFTHLSNAINEMNRVLGLSNVVLSTEQRCIVD